MKIIILDLPREVNKANLNDLFKQFGKIDKCDVVMDTITNKSKGFGFVEMGDKEGVEAIAKLNGTKFSGKKIRVKIAAK